MAGPDSSYSCLEIHICWKVEREARIDPPIQTEYFLKKPQCSVEEPKKKLLIFGSKILVTLADYVGQM
jgi:hypothetical protein